MVVLGATLVPASLLAGLLTPFYVDGAHPGKVAEAAGGLMLAYVVSVLALPLLALATGLAALLATNEARLKLAVVLAAVLTVDLAVAPFLYHVLWSQPCRPHPLPPGPTPMPAVVDATGCVPSR